VGLIRAHPAAALLVAVAVEIRVPVGGKKVEERRNDTTRTAIKVHREGAQEAVEIRVPVGG
jgi:hypothetical protein